MKSKRTKATDIKMSVKKIVWERDCGACVVCGKTGYGVMPNAHYLSRGQHLGLGIEKNVVTLCFMCHHKYDQTTEHEQYKEFIKNYLVSKYEDWNEEDLVYRK